VNQMYSSQPVISITNQLIYSREDCVPNDVVVGMIDPAVLATAKSCMQCMKSNIWSKQNLPFLKYVYLFLWGE
jgi:hypothetical protein